MTARSSHVRRQKNSRYSARLFLARPPCVQILVSRYHIAIIRLSNYTGMGLLQLKGWGPQYSGLRYCLSRRRSMARSALVLRFQRNEIFTLLLVHS